MKKCLWHLARCKIEILVFLFGLMTSLSGCGVIWTNSSVPIPCAGTSLNTPYAAGTGQLMSPYQICTSAQLNNIGLRPQDWNASFILENNIDLSTYTGTQFNLIGNYAGAQPFTGTFNGNNFTIYNFNYSNTTIASGVGLFGYIAGSAAISNLTLLNPIVSGGGVANYVGALVGFDDGLGGASLTNIVISGNLATVTSSAAGQYAGGVAGSYTGSANFVSSSANVLATNLGDVGGVFGYYDSVNTISLSSTGSVTGNSRVGGLIGGTNGVVTLINSYSNGTVTETGGGQAGGIIGYDIGAILSHCYFTGTVSGSSFVGGISGVKQGGSISHSWANTSVTGTANKIGGLIGGVTASASISNSYSYGSLSGASQVGGLVGSLGPTAAGYGIYNSFSSANVTGTVSRVGGLAGYVSTGSPDIQYSYASGLVSGPANVGGILGQDSGSGVYVSVFFDSTVNSTINGVGAGSAASQLAQNGVNVFGDITTLMQTPGTFTGAGWSTAIWKLISGSYPTFY